MIGKMPDPHLDGIRAFYISDRKARQVEDTERSAKPCSFKWKWYSSGANIGLSRLMSFTMLSKSSFWLFCCIQPAGIRSCCRRWPSGSWWCPAPMTSPSSSGTPRRTRSSSLAWRDIRWEIKKYFNAHEEYIMFCHFFLLWLINLSNW